MCKRYVKDRPIHAIEKRQGDSSAWKVTLLQRDDIAKCAALGPNYSMIWVGKGTKNSIRNATETLRTHNLNNALAKGIWANKIGKVILNLAMTN